MTIFVSDMPKDAEITVINEIKAQRKLLKLSAEDMAKRLCCHKRTYWRMEAGSMTVKEMEEVCEILQLKILIIKKSQL